MHEHVLWSYTCSWLAAACGLALWCGAPAWLGLVVLVLALVSAGLQASVMCRDGGATRRRVAGPPDLGKRARPGQAPRRCLPS